MSDPREQKSYLLRLPKPIFDAFQKWAEDELRSLNGQLEYVLRNALKEEGRMPKLSNLDPASEIKKREGKSKS
jgi:hypothetical protein